MSTYRKSRANAPQGFFPCEAAGLQWLQEGQFVGGPRVVDVYHVTESYLDIEQVVSASPTPSAAYQFGVQLAKLHNLGAQYFGSAPAGYRGICYFGPLQDPVPMDCGAWDTVHEYFIEGRLRPMVEMGIQRRTLTRGDMALIDELDEAFETIVGEEAASDTPSRIHGDLWSGNVMWTISDTGDTEAILIDPAAHGGHREEDLAMLSLFGMSYYTQILDGYRSVQAIPSGFAQRQELWQLYPIAGHCVFFGGGYVSQFRSMAHHLLDNLA